MAKNKHKSKRRGLSRKPPVLVGITPQPITIEDRIVPKVQGGGVVTLFSNHPSIQVTAKLRRPVAPPVPKPRVSVVERPGTVSLTHWNGRDPYELTLPIMLDVYGSPGINVEKQIEKLEQLAVRHRGDDEPPVVQLTGPVPDPTGVRRPKWRIAGFEELTERTLFNDNGRRVRWAVDVRLIEHVQDDVLAASIERGIETVGIEDREITVKKGERTFYDVAKRVYGDKSKAKALARANGMLVTTKLQAGTHLRRP